jgi:hypothetical protein
MRCAIAVQPVMHEKIMEMPAQADVAGHCGLLVRTREQYAWRLQ